MERILTTNRRADAPASPVTPGYRLAACAMVAGMGMTAYIGEATAADPPVSHVVSGSWRSTDFRDPSNPGCSMGGTGPFPGSRLIMGASQLHPDPMSLVIRKTGWTIPPGTRVEIVASFPDGFSMKLPGTGKGNTIDILLGTDQLASWVHGLTASSGMQLSFGGSEPPWTFDLTGTTTVVNAMGDCFRSHQITGVGAPFAFGVSIAGVPGEPTQPFGAPSPLVARKVPAAPATALTSVDTETSVFVPRPPMAAIAVPNGRGMPPVGKTAATTPAAYQPVMEIFAEDPTRPVFHGRTNLPDGAELMLTLTRPESGFMAQTKMSVASGAFVTERISQGGSPLNPGTYKLEISMSLAVLQPAAVRAVVGEHGERMSGPLVTPSAISPEEQVFDYVKTIQLGGPANAASDAAAKAKSFADLRDWMARGCTDNLDFVNTMVRSGAVTGREVLGEERQRRIEACEENARTRPMP